jgi:hypothetical protein
MGWAATVKRKRYGPLLVIRPFCDLVSGERTPGKRHEERDNDESSRGYLQGNTSPKY